jgi:NAD(P)-dependent dehydrogenase (short-subunit alcohol dehydrogenase family)
MKIWEKTDFDRWVVVNAKGSSFLTEATADPWEGYSIVLDASGSAPIGMPSALFCSATRGALISLARATALTALLQQYRYYFRIGLQIQQRDGSSRPFTDICQPATIL